MGKANTSKELMTESDARKHIMSLFGEESVIHPEQNIVTDVFTTRSPALDRALGIGGWAGGRIYQLAGKPSSGKTFMALVAMAEWQSLDPENCCCFIDAEYTYDPKWAASLGVDNDRVLLIKSNEAQKIFEGLLGFPKKNKVSGKVTQIPGLLGMIQNGQMFEYVANNRKIKLNLGKMGVIVLDSIAAMAAPAEMESEVGKINMAPLSRFLTVELRKLTPQVAWSNVCFIAINHVKEKIGVTFGNPETTPGGAAFKHACSVMLMVSPISTSEALELDSNEEVIGRKIRIKVDKNKMSLPYKVAEFYIDFNKGVDKVAEQLFEVALLADIIKRPTSVSYELLGQKVVGRDSAIELVNQHKDEINTLIREKYKSGLNIVSEADENSPEFPEGTEEVEV